MHQPAISIDPTSAPTPRRCGECDVCCTAMSVTALNKPVGMRCPHMGATGCGNYDNRPAACRDWYCMWLRDSKNILREDERPDRIGIFLTASKPTDHGTQVIYAHPIRPDALSSPSAQALIARMRQFAPVHVLAWHGAATPLTLRGQPVMPSAA